MNPLNAILTRLFDWLLAPFEAWPLAGLVFWSAVCGVAMTFVFGKTSNQAALKRAADRTRAQLLAIKLFKDDLAVTFRCQVQLLKATGWRLLHSLPPMVVLIVPFTFILSQLGLRYEHQPLNTDRATVVSMQLSPSAWEQYQNVELEAPSNVVVETESLRDASQTTLYWRLRTTAAQTNPLRWTIGDQAIEKQLAVANDTGMVWPVSVRRPGPALIDRLLHPGETAFSNDGPVLDISVQHARRSTPVFGLDVPWWGTFFIVSILAALVVRRVLGVQF